MQEWFLLVLIKVWTLSISVEKALSMDRVLGQQVFSHCFHPVHILGYSILH